MKTPLCLLPLALSLLAVAAVPRVGAAVDVSAIENLRPALPVIPDRVFNLFDFGGVGDGRTDNTAAFARAIAAVEAAGGGRLLVPAGVFVTGPFALCSQLELHLAEGATIQAPDSFAAQQLPDPASFRTQAELKAAFPEAPPPLIHGRKLHDVAITGSGTIDGRGEHWWVWSERAARKVATTEPGRLVVPRPHLVVIERCERLRIADITLRHSPKFHLVPRFITDLTIERVKVRAPFDAPNTDAIDPGPGTNFLIRGCDIDTGDDDIVLKRGATNVLIEDCTIRHGHGISIGSETSDGVANVLVRRCTLTGTDNGLRIKSMRGAGGLVRNIRYTDIRMSGVPNAIVLDLTYVDNNRPDFRGDPALVPMIRDVLLDHVTIEGSERAGRILGLPDSRIIGITLRDTTITAEKDLVVRDADEPVFENVTRNIAKGVAPKRQEYVE
ncbi:MAG: glycosyl hydrolase family 28 protein [Opitutaceae bacterium]